MRTKQRATNTETLSLPFELKKDSMTEDGTFEGYASVFGVVDLGSDVVIRGAFAKSLGSGRRVKMLWQHDTRDVIGVWEEIREDERGLFVRGRLIGEVQKGREALALMRAGAIDGMSIGFRNIHSEYTDDGLRKLTEIELHEISVVTFPMLPDATVNSVKSIKTERDFEKFLRDAGFSKSEAVAIASRGYKAAMTGERDAGSDDRRDAEAEKRSVDMNDLSAVLTKLRNSIHA